MKVLTTTNRLYFIDAMRAWAILMMLQGHYIDGLLDSAFRDNTDVTYSVWKYFRGITAPVFFTVSGFIFTYLLIRVPQDGLQNPRVHKGVKRGLQLLFIGYLLRLNLLGLLQGEIYDSFYFVDVLHCIGFSLLGIIGIYLMTQHRRKFLFPLALLVTTIVLFLFEPYYKVFSYSFMPKALANYFTRENGSVFTIFPWFGYSTIGAFLSVLFTRFKGSRYLYPLAIVLTASLGSLLIFYSSDLFLKVSNLTGFQLFADIYFNNYLFIRLGDVFVVFAIFMVFRRILTNSTVLKIGQSTLSIYIVHFIVLYGSFTGLGLYGFFHHSLTPAVAIPTALIFMVLCTFTALQYEKHKKTIISSLYAGLKFALAKAEFLSLFIVDFLRANFTKLLRNLGLVKN